MSKGDIGEMMARTCTICSHEKRAAIEDSIVAGASNRSIALQFGMSHMAVQRHAIDHIAQEIKQSQEAKEEAQGLDIVKQLKDINKITLEILRDARADDTKQAIALQAIDRVCKQLELQAKLLGAIDTPQINIMFTPEWHAIRGTIIAALVPFPDARVAVAGALARLEDSHARLN